MKLSTVLLMGIGAAICSQVGMAEAKYGMAGCGLGSLVIQDHGNFPQIFAATTNNTSGNQSFGITSGTSNCTTATQMAALKAQENFVAQNLSTLSKEMAKGEGEALRSFASTFGCEEAAFSAFAETLQASYSEIYQAPGAMAVLNNIRTTLKKDAVLPAKCENLI